MLNFADPTLQTIAITDLSAKDAHRQISALFAEKQAAMLKNPLWDQNEPAMLNMTQSYTQMLGDKLIQALVALPELPQDFANRLWFDVQVQSGNHSQLTFYLTDGMANVALLAIDDALTPAAHLVAQNLPTLLQVTAKDPEQLGYDQLELDALSTLIKGLYAAELTFATIDETVLQPVDGLRFPTRYDNSQTLTTTVTIEEPGPVELQVALHGAVVSGYHVLDEDGHDWLDLGSDSRHDDYFTWAATAIPEDLIDHTLTLEVQVRTGESSPALDELFVIASSHAILMRQGDQPGSYALVLPNHNTLTVALDAAHDEIELRYPDPSILILELNHQYPFVGEWLKAVLPQRRAFN